MIIWRNGRANVTSVGPACFPPKLWNIITSNLYVYTGFYGVDLSTVCTWKCVAYMSVGETFSWVIIQPEKLEIFQKKTKQQKENLLLVDFLLHFRCRWKIWGLFFMMWNETKKPKEIQKKKKKRNLFSHHLPSPPLTILYFFFC